MNSDGDVHEALGEYAMRVVDSLADGLSASGRLTDPGTGDPVPDHYYANTCFAVAAFRAAARSGAERQREAAISALDYYLSLDPDRRGHDEFNAFALLEAIDDARRGRYELPVPESRLRESIRFQSRIDSREGNNWLLLRGYCHLRLARLFGRRRDRLAFHRIRRLVRGWQQDDGLLADAPRYPLAPAETPLTYHSKLGALCARIAVDRPDGKLSSVAMDAFRALDAVCLPSGEALYFGRSENTVFGYATALDGAFRIAGSDPWVSDLRRRLASYLLDSFDPELGNAQPGGLDASPIDEYVVDGVYAAYAAMLLLGLPRDEVSASGRGPEMAPERSLQTAGLSIALGRRSALGIATEGQVKFIGGGADPRYAGLVPLTFTFDGETVGPGVPREFLDGGPMPYLPTVEHESERLAPVTWATSHSSRGRLTSFVGDGRFHRLHDPGDHPPSGEESRLASLGATPRKIDATIRALARKGKVDLLIERWRKRAEPVPFSTRRAIHLLGDADALVVQTATVFEEAASIVPTSWVVTESFVERTEIQYGEDDLAVRSSVAHTHKGPATWLVPDETRGNDPVWSVVVLDPGNDIRDATHVLREGVLLTECALEGGRERLTLEIPGGSSAGSGGVPSTTE